MPREIKCQDRIRFLVPVELGSGNKADVPSEMIRACQQMHIISLSRSSRCGDIEVARN